MERVDRTVEVKHRLYECPTPACRAKGSAGRVLIRKHLMGLLCPDCHAVLAFTGHRWVRARKGLRFGRIVADEERVVLATPEDAR